MNLGSISRIKLLGLASLPLLAVMVAVMVFAWGQSSPTTSEAANTPPRMWLDAGGGAVCDVPGEPDKCSITTGSSFTLIIHADSGGATVTGAATETVFNGLSYVTKGCASEIKMTPAGFCPAPVIAAAPDGPVVAHGVGTALLPPRPPATSIDPLVEMPNVSCTTPGTYTVHLVAKSGARPLASTLSDDAGDIPVKVVASPLIDFGAGPVATDVADSLDFNCADPTDTPTPTDTSTPTDTPTPTNTPAQPPLFKTPDLQNLWLTRQGTKIPPTSCAGPIGGNDTAEFTYGTDTAVTLLDPKGSGKIVDVGAFEFEVHFDDQKVCVELQPGTDAKKMNCFIEDAVTKPALEGVARIGCVTLGKPVLIDGVWDITVSAAIGDSICTGTIENNVEIDIGVAVLPAVPESVAASFACAQPPSATDVFGWISHPALGTGYDNASDSLTGIIPCTDPVNQICVADGTIAIDFTENSLSGAGEIELGDPPPPGALVPFTITGERIGRLPVSDLATVVVRPQPDVYSQAKPNQDNGVVVQLNNQKCELADLQGHAIPNLSCEDADVTIRFLEGDVEPDCTIDTLDTQAIGFRWGADKGSLLYLDRFNLEPSGTQSDDDIDIKDLQFVYGRFGSSCSDPHPVQDPVNPKA